MDLESVVKRLDTDGYAVIENHLAPDDVQRKRDDLARILSKNPTGRNDFEGFSTQRIYAVFAKTRTFDAQATDPLILGACEHVLGAGFQLSAPVGISIGPGEKAQPVHRDDGVYPVRRPHRELVLNTMWALDDFTEANGATVVIPGSHRWIDERPSEESRVVHAVMPAGSVMLFVGSIHHGGGANTTDRARLGVILEYCAGWVRPQENHILGVPKEIVRDLDPRLQELLGYSVLGLLGNVDGRNPKKYIEDAREVRDGVLDL
jgi:ectoine hydroxylase-related dioxygenase (phytanoyl-CoA dioxygenase family)